MPPETLTADAFAAEPTVASPENDDVIFERPWLLVSAAFVKTGGQDRANYALASYLARHAQHVHLVSHRVSDDIATSDRVTLHTAPRPLHSDLLGEPFLQRMGAAFAKTLDNAYVVANGGNCACADVNWVHYVHATYVPSHDGGVVLQTKQQLAHRLFLRDERRAIGTARIVIANSQRTATDLTERVGIDPARVRVIYYGIDPDEFRPAAVDERRQLRSVLGWSQDRPVVLFIGALGDRRKGFDTLFAAWQRIARMNGLDPMLVVIGRGAMLDEWRRRAAEEGLDRSMTFLGFRDDVPKLVQAADLLVAPTRYEAYGLGVHEAICCGLPAVVSARAGVAERYPAELRGLLLSDPEDVDELASRMIDCLDRHSVLTGGMQPFAAELRRRTWDDMAHDIFRTVSA